MDTTPSVPVPPAQRLSVGVMTTVGVGDTFTLMVLLVTQPPVAVTDTVYTPPAVTVVIGPIDPLDQV